MNKFAFILCLMTVPFVVCAQRVSNIVVNQHMGKVEISYQLTDSAYTTISISTDGGRFFNQIKGSISGNIYGDTKTGINIINWDVHKDFPNMALNGIVLRVAAIAPNNTILSYVDSRTISISKDVWGLDVMPFSVYAKDFVENTVNEWQKRGEFEKTVDWQKRVNADTRAVKIKEVTVEAEHLYIDTMKKTIKLNFSLSQYDPDNEIFLIRDSSVGNLLVPVPISEAPYFKANWNLKELYPSFFIDADYLGLASLEIKMPNGKTYRYSNQASLNYSVADVEYNFEPIEIESSNAPIQRGQQSIEQKKLTVGKSLVDINIPQSSVRNNNHTFALIIANENYKRVDDVPCAKNDGQIFKKYCVSALGMPNANVHYVENATLNDMRTEIAWLRMLAEAYQGDVQIIFYYAGHGMPDESNKSSFLLPVDGDGRLPSSGYQLDELYRNLGDIPAHSVTIFMDACFSGSKREDGMLASARGIAIKAKSGVPQGNMVVFSAAQGDETAYPNKEEGHGMFTYYLLKKLQDTKGDVTLQDLGNYITKNVSQQSILINGKSQTPSVIASSTLGDTWQNWKLK